MWCTVHNQDIADITLKAFLLNWLTLFRTLSWRAPPNLQDGNVLLLERSDASPTLFLLVRLPCDFYFLQVDNICSMISHHKLVRSQCLSCLQYLFPSRSARLTELLNIVWQIKLTLINASNYKYEISHFEVTFQWAWSWVYRVYSITRVVVRVLLMLMAISFPRKFFLVSLGSRRAIVHLFVMLSAWTSQKASRV